MRNNQLLVVLDMRWVGVVVCALLLAGSISAQRAQNVTVGQNYTFNVIIFTEIVSCHLTTPDNETLDLTFDKPSEHERYELQPLNINLTSCSVLLKDVNESDAGIWKITARDAAGNPNSELIDLSVLPAEYNFLDTVDVIWLNSIDYPTAYGQSIDITLSKKNYAEECYFRTPTAPEKVENGNVDGVVVQDSSDFVSCRITIGPMSETLLGDWVLCAKRTDDSKARDRCQRVKISWYSIKSPSTLWGILDQPKFDHVVNFDSMLTPLVQGSGDRVTCHIITPNGEDLVIDSDSDYPDLSLIRTETFICSVAIGRIKASLLGDWTLYGKFRDFTGIHEVRLPMNLFLYDEDNPYNQAYNITIKDPVQRFINLGSTVNMDVNGTGTMNDCEVVTPDGKMFDQATLSYEGVSFVPVQNGVMCRVALGPLTEQQLGNWKVIGKFRNGDRFTEVHQSFDVIKAVYGLEVGDPVQRGVDLGTRTNLDVSGTGNVDDCAVVTPSGDRFERENLNYVGVEFMHVKKATICRLAVGPLTEQLLGKWKIIGKFSNRDSFIEKHQTFELIKADEFVQTYHVNIRDPVQRAVNLGSTLNMDVNSTGSVDGCEVVTPAGERFDQASLDYEGVLFVSVRKSVTCRIALGPLTEQLLGNWTVIGKFKNGDRFTEEHQSFDVLKEDPANPILDEERIIYNLSGNELTTVIGGQHRLTIQSNSNIDGQSCHIRTPAGLQYQLMPGFNVPGVTLLSNQKGIECGVTIHVLSEDSAGSWTLIARATQRSQLIERRLPLTINIEEKVDAIPKKVTIFEGNDLYVRLVSSTDEYHTCKLNGPTGSKSAHVVDPLHVQKCGFIIMNVTSVDAGAWEITYGSRIMYTATIDVSVQSTIDADFPSTINLIRGQSVNIRVGPENAVYCRLEDPYGSAVYEGFGSCLLSIVEVSSRHQGAWNMLATPAGRVVAVPHQLYINVTEEESKPVVSTSVSEEKPIVTLSCSVESAAAARGCAFRDPQGRVLRASAGVADGLYVTSYESTERNHKCSLRINNPLPSEMGIWRCAIETEAATHYGFQDVFCPWVLDSESAAIVQQGPILTAQRSWVYAVEGQPVDLSCSVDAAIRYCYFRAENGTTFTVHPGMTPTSIEYVGAGFEAGECTVRLHDVSSGDHGLWSCHVGLYEDHGEQRDIIHLTLQQQMRVRHLKSSTNMIVEGLVYDAHALDYCRFVRIDGFGFSSDRTPTGYVDSSNLESGVCQLTIPRPTILDHNPWTVAARIHGQDAEISKSTVNTVVGPGGNEVGAYDASRVVFIFFYVFLSALLFSIILGSCLGPKKNREWAYSRASSLRRSMRNSFKKTPLPPPAPVSGPVSVTA